MLKKIEAAVLSGMLMVFPVCTWAADHTAQNSVKRTQTMSLSSKQQSFAQIGAYTAQGNIDRLKTAVNQALSQGMTVNEIRDAMVQLYAYTGFPRSLNALGALDQVVKERHSQGQTVMMGREGKRPDGYDALKNGTQTQTALTGRSVDLSALSPDIDLYLKTHLFGDIFANDLLTWQEREIVTIAALSQLDGAENQLNAHIKVGKHNGLTDDQVREITDIVGAERSPFAGGQFNSAYAQYFQGNSYLARLSDGELPVSNVTFEPGTRNHWHTHAATKGGGQVLIVTAGRGWYQEWNQPARELKPGDVVSIPANVKHWHGAAKDSWFQHLAIAVPGENVHNYWHEPVSDADYAKLKSSSNH